MCVCMCGGGSCLKLGHQISRDRIVVKAAPFRYVAGNVFCNERCGTREHGNTCRVVLDVAVHSVFGVEVSLPPSSYSFASLLGRKGFLAGARPSAAL